MQNKKQLPFDLAKIVPHRGKAHSWDLLGVQTNPGNEFKRAIRITNSWAIARSKSIKSFDILLFEPTDYYTIPVPIWEHTGYAQFVAVYYANKSGAFPVADYPAN